MATSVPNIVSPEACARQAAKARLAELEARLQAVSSPEFPDSSACADIDVP